MPKPSINCPSNKFGKFLIPAKANVVKTYTQEIEIVEITKNDG